MQLKPKKQYHAPAYATRAILDAHPELLRLVPKRWQTNTLVLTAVAAAGLIVSTRWSGAESKQPAEPSHVAPLFEHGDGHAAFGCMAVSPPVFLTEDEARKVITEEAGKHGIHFTADKRTLNNIAVPLTDPFGAVYDKETKARLPSTQRASLALDGTDMAKHINYEFITEHDYQSWNRKEKPKSRMSIGSYDIIGAAHVLRDGIQQAHPAGAYAVFYDPITSLQGFRSQQQREESERAAHELARAELRKQVQDFIVWLKAEGVI
ncbi:MAG TPA: hypothetical protein VGL77_14845 [Armatimonadota bacterium]|jgi:hypothetical protein